MDGTVYAFAVDGLAALIADAKGLNPENDVALQRAINYAADSARSLAADLIGREVNLGRDYLSAAGGRLTVARRASVGDLEAAIVGKQRPVSLARFTAGGSPGATGMFVKVKADGGGKVLKKAFFMKLRRGSELTDSIYNLGLAVRSNTPLANKRIAKVIGKNLYLLYGPSVDQVFRSVVKDSKFTRSVEADFLVEFERQMRLKG